MLRQEQEAWKQDATDNGFRGQLRVMTEGDRLFVAGFFLCVCLFHFGLFFRVLFVCFFVFYPKGYRN